MLTGGEGNDVLDGGGGADTLGGGEGYDLADYSARTAPVSLTLDGAANDGEAGEQDFARRRRPRAAAPATTRWSATARTTTSTAAPVPT